MAERHVSGIAIAATSTAARAIARLPTGITAFVGRALKGPVNRPVELASFAQFQQIFGGLWQPSTLSYAIEQYFESGGRQAYVVRVINGACPPTVSLPAGTGELRLAAVNPGSREYLRASVDYDGIDADDSDRFNLVVQRLRAPGSELIEDQEIFRRLSIACAADRFVTDELLDSQLVRVIAPVPQRRPNRTVPAPGSDAAGYSASNTDGDDGGPLCDYDLIGSAAADTGMFALRSIAAFNLLCIPPLSRDHDVGLSTLMIAARFCRERGAMLMVDPPASWTSPGLALEGLRDWPFRSENALMYFPRVLAFDRLRGRIETFASSAAAAGMLARADETWPVWASIEGEEAVLRPGLRPAIPVTESERGRLAQAGANVLLAVRTGASPAMSARTLAVGSSAAADWEYLSARRLALFICASIDRGTRWVIFEQNDAATRAAAQREVEGFLEALDQDHAFAGAAPEESYFAICDERVNTPESVAEGKLKVLFGFATLRPGDFHAFLLTHELTGSHIRPVSPNRHTTSQRLLEWEIESSILKGLVLE